jgi:hypothetical protein
MMNNRSSILPLASEDFINGQIAVCALLLEADARERTLQRPYLTTEGASYLLQLLAFLRSGRSPDIFLSLPYWDSGRLQLWWGGILLKEFAHRDSHQTTVLCAFQRRGWAHRRIRNPLQPEGQESLEACTAQLEQTLKNINKQMPKGTICFRLTEDRLGAEWDVSAPSLSNGAPKNRQRGREPA